MKIPLLAFAAALALSTAHAHAKKDANTTSVPEGKKVQPPKPVPKPTRTLSAAEEDDNLSEDAAAKEKLHLMMAPGNYKCTGTSTPPGEQKSHPMSARVPIVSEMDGLWEQVRYEENKSAEHPHPMKAIQFFTYDTVNKVFLRTAVDSFGNAFNMTADNTDGERLTFTGHASLNGTTVPARLIWEKIGKDMKVAWEWSPGEGNWFRAVDLTCRL